MPLRLIARDGRMAAGEGTGSAPRCANDKRRTPVIRTEIVPIGRSEARARRESPARPRPRHRRHRPSALRRLRRAPRPVRLRRHLRARAPRGRRTRVPPRRAGADARAGATIVRYPGGNFVSGYNWEDGVGPRERRPRRLDLAWLSTETNAFGPTNSSTGAGRPTSSRCSRSISARAVRTRRATWSSTATIRAAPRSPTCAARTARSSPTASSSGAWATRWTARGRWARRRGRIRPNRRETAKLMKWVDPTIELAACGSSGRNMPTFGTWE